MKTTILLVVIAIQLSLFTLSFAQITFTREWVTGKRSSLPKLKILMHEEDETFCKSLIPAIDYLLEVEKVHQRVCASLNKAMPMLYKKPQMSQQEQGLNDLNLSSRASSVLDEFDGSNIFDNSHHHQQQQKAT